MKRISSKARAVAFTSDLESCAKIYCAILNSGHPFWNPYGDVTRRLISDMNILQVKEVRPLLIAVIRKFSVPQAILALRHLTSCVVRSLVVTGRGGLLENTYAQIAKDITDGRLTKERQLRETLRDVIPGDEEFRKYFSTATSSNSQRVRYFLREIERAMNVVMPEWIPSDSVDDVSLEHVLPRATTNDWAAFDDEEQRSYVNRIGNLAILASGANSTLGNCSFARKKEVFKQSSFRMAASIARSKAWTPVELTSVKMS